MKAIGDMSLSKADLQKFQGMHLIIRKDDADEQPELLRLCKDLEITVHSIDPDLVVSMLNTFGCFEPEEKIWKKGNIYFVPADSPVFNKHPGNLLSEIIQ